MMCSNSQLALLEYIFKMLLRLKMHWYCPLFFSAACRLALKVIVSFIPVKLVFKSLLSRKISFKTPGKMLTCRNKNNLLTNVSEKSTQIS